MSDEMNNVNPEQENNVNDHTSEQEQAPQSSNEQVDTAAEKIVGKPVEKTQISQDSKNLALLCHLLGIFTIILGPLVIWLLNKDKDEYLDKQGKESLNFQLTVLIICGGLSILTVIGMPIIMIVLLANTIFRILATVAASKGEDYKYPYSFKILK